MVMEVEECREEEFFDEKRRLNNVPLIEQLPEKKTRRNYNIRGKSKIKNVNIRYFDSSRFNGE
jgi:hypothetical protein